MKKHIPNILTSLNLLCGWASIYFSFKGDFSLSMSLIVFASLFDFLDGFAAKKLNVQSDLGAQLDSFADLVTFGIAPSIVVYKLSTFTDSNLSNNLQLFIFLLIGLIPVFAAIRLAKFNINKEKTNHFIGLPSPAFALIVVAFSSMFIAYDKQISNFTNYQFVFPCIMILISLLMVSKLKFISFKFDNYNFNQNKLRYLLIICSVLSSMFLLIIGKVFFITPMVLLLYILFSLSSNLEGLN